MFTRTPVRTVPDKRDTKITAFRVQLLLVCPGIPIPDQMDLHIELRAEIQSWGHMDTQMIPSPKSHLPADY